MTCNDKVIIVYKQSDFKKYEGIKQGFLVDPNNKRQLDKARQWGTEFAGVNLFGQTNKLEPLEYFTDNDGFKITIAESADASSQGGKLSFWNCIVEKDGHKFMIGINQDILLSLIQQSTIVNGVVQEPCKLVKMSGTAGAIHYGMAEMKHINQAKSGSMPSKTTIWKVGQSYKTKTKNEIYIGKIYSWFDVTTHTVTIPNKNSYFGSTQITHHHYKLMDKPVEAYALSNVHNYYIDGYEEKITSGEIHKVSQVYDEILNELKKKYKGKIARWEIRNLLEFLFSDEKRPTKPIAREIGKIKLEEDDYIKSAKALLDHFKSMVVNGEVEIHDYYLEGYIGYTMSAEDRPSFTEEEKEKILKNLSNTIHIDFGDGVELTGTKNN